jgi:hypothetical protein
LLNYDRHGPQASIDSTFSLTEWSARPEVQEAWWQLAAQHGISFNPFGGRDRARIFSFADSAIIGDAAMTISIRKARKHGFFGTVDSYDSMLITLKELAGFGLIPPPIAGTFKE